MINIDETEHQKSAPSPIKLTVQFLGHTGCQLFSKQIISFYRLVKKFYPHRIIMNNPKCVLAIGERSFEFYYQPIISIDQNFTMVVQNRAIPVGYMSAI